MEEDFEKLVKNYQEEKRRDADPERMIELLTEISRISYEERLLGEWFLWYWKAGYPARAKRVCKQLKQFFPNSIWASRADEALEMLKASEDLPGELEERWLWAEDEETDASPTGQPGLVPAEKTEAWSDSGREGKSVVSSEGIPPIIEEAFRGIVGMESVKRELVSFYNIARLEKLRERELNIDRKDRKSVV